MAELSDLIALARRTDPDRLYEIVKDLPPGVATALLDEIGARGGSMTAPASPLEQAQALMPNFVTRAHLEYLSERIAAAVEAMERGGSPRLIVEMPPRSGKSLLATQVTPAWYLATHPSAEIMLASYSSPLATSWARTIRRWAADGKLSGLRIADDSAKAGEWETTEGGMMLATSIRGEATGRGAKLLIVDDPHKNFADAHSEASRDEVWNWWLSTSNSRLEPHSIVIVILTRWHEDDLAGRLLSKEYPGDPSDWEVIRFPAIAEEEDVLGREPGSPLLSPLDEEETVEQALKRWERVKRDSGSYVWAALYQQRPAPAEGAMVKVDWFRYWTTDPDLADPLLADGTPDPKAKTMLIDPNDLSTGKWLDSWDMTFKGKETSDYVVGQRWVRKGANRYLMAQQRDRMDFPATIAAMKVWAGADPAVSPYGHLVHQRLIEDAANGPAVVSTLKDKISGLKPITARVSKEQRVHAVSPEIESGNVLLPHPSMPGYSWVADLIAELREFPNGAHDDQVDAMSQALLELRETSAGGIGIPGQQQSSGGGLPIPGGARQRSRTASAATMRRAGR